ncbi:vanadium-dependent haloperoxidase [Aurantiacibacter zhengii]|uniref:Phosphatase PAP2 family protein n=1 Tax=Aurantiacibacter zhengii TaxID=2307003 RepID=A0A418NRC6_9SPHN|nr:vanadium-dependent haloperoxidase [Aurantiacibacter zhengii]RIV85640.1 phosphatase PAP2 family protein [Aurantiacibacter zhengii]
MNRRNLLKSGCMVALAGGALRPVSALAAEQHLQHAGLSIGGAQQSLAYHWLDTLLDVAAEDVVRNSARPTVLARAMAIVTAAMYEAWVPFDDRARGPLFGDSLRRPAAERTLQNKQAAISYAAACALGDLYPESRASINTALRRFGFDPARGVAARSSAIGIGVLVGERLCAMKHSDGANQLGDETGSSGVPYSDYTQYAPVNPPDTIYNPDRWQPITFRRDDGSTFAPGFLTPQWYRVEPFALASPDQFRAPEPPRVGSDRLRAEIDEVLAYNAGLTDEQKAIVEFMRDGPGSTGQSGHWLRFAQDISRRDGNDLDTDVKLFFQVGQCAHDAFIASWDSKRYWDTSRPWTLVRHYYGDRTIRGWGGPGRGTVEMRGSEWYPYSPYVFVSPPFPSYVSGHSTVSAACAETLRLFTGSDRLEVELVRHPGEITEPDALGAEVTLWLPSLTESAEMAGISRIMGGYHIQADNIEGLRMGRSVGQLVHDRAQDLFGHG